jgi:hypothetical protein
MGLGLLTKITVYVGAGLFAATEFARWAMARLQGRRFDLLGEAPP